MITLLPLGPKSAAADPELSDWLARGALEITPTISTLYPVR
jgi:hypothetical protein